MTAGMPTEIAREIVARWHTRTMPPITPRMRADLVRAIAAAIEDAEKRGYDRGFDEAFVRGVRALGDVWSELLKPIFAIKDGFDEIESLHDRLFNTVEGRAEGAPSLFDVPAAHWTNATGRWADIMAGIEQRATQADVTEPDHG